MKYTDGYIFTDHYDRLAPAVPYAVAQEHSGLLLERLLRTADQIDQAISERLGKLAIWQDEIWVDEDTVFLHEQVNLCRESAIRLIDFGAAAEIGEEAETWLQLSSE